MTSHNPADREMMQETTQIGYMSVSKVMHETPRASYKKQMLEGLDFSRGLESSGWSK